MAPSALARFYLDPVFVKTISLASSYLASPVTNLASVFNETALPLATASYIRAAARTSGLFSPQLAPSQIQPALETRSFRVPAPAGSDPIAHLADITGTAMSSAPNIDSFIKGCQFQTIAAPPSLSNHPEAPLLQSLATSVFPEAVGNPLSLDAIRYAIKRVLTPPPATHLPPCFVLRSLHTASLEALVFF